MELRNSVSRTLPPYLAQIPVRYFPKNSSLSQSSFIWLNIKTFCGTNDHSETSYSSCLSMRIEFGRGSNHLSGI